MSKYLCFSDIVYTNEALLLQALQDLGWTRDQIEVAPHQHLYGYEVHPGYETEENARAETADIVIRRQHIPGPSNDLGFKKTDKGYVPLVSEYDVHGFKSGSARQFTGGRDITVAVREKYSERVIREIARQKRGTIKRSQQGKVQRITVSF